MELEEWIEYQDLDELEDLFRKEEYPHYSQEDYEEIFEDAFADWLYERYRRENND